MPIIFLVMVNFIEFKKKCNMKLKECGVKDCKHNTLLLCEKVLKIDKNKLIFVDKITSEQAKRIYNLIEKRCLGEPLQYLIGYTEFYDNKIYVNKNVLIPRNETEQLCDIISNNIKGNCKILDLCCGSGCIGLGLKKHNKNTEITLSDISIKALSIAKKNANENNLTVKFKCSNLFEKLNEKYDIIVSNPPYIKTEDIKSLEIEVQKEPIIALDGKDDGLYFYKEIIKNAIFHLNKNGEIYFECGIKQAKIITKYLEKNFKCIKIIKDYYGVNRFVYAKLKD